MSEKLKRQKMEEAKNKETKEHMAKTLRKKGMPEDVIYAYMKVGKGTSYEEMFLNLNNQEFVKGWEDAIKEYWNKIAN